MDDDDSSGLSPSNRNYIVGLVFFALLMLGPVQPYGMLVRAIYLIAIPFAAWLAIRFIGRHLEIDAQSNDYIHRAITASLAGMLILAAYQSFAAKSHWECEQYTPDGFCDGETLKKLGPDRGNSVLFIVFAGLAFTLSISRRSSE